jgi:hypothetical protein
MADESDDDVFIEHFSDSDTDELIILPNSTNEKIDDRRQPQNLSDKKVSELNVNGDNIPNKQQFGADDDDDGIEDDFVEDGQDDEIEDVINKFLFDMADEAENPLFSADSGDNDNINVNNDPEGVMNSPRESRLNEIDDTVNNDEVSSCCNDDHFL